MIETKTKKVVMKITAKLVNRNSDLATQTQKKEILSILIMQETGNDN
jgi:hypothetical protein